MSLHFIGQRFRVSRGGCWQCGSDCSSQLAEVLTFSSVAYNVELDAVQRGGFALRHGVKWLLGGVVLRIQVNRLHG